MYNNKEIQIDEEVQKNLNQPLKDPKKMDKVDSDFLELIIKLIQDGKIDLYKPSTLINDIVYDNLTSELKGKADFAAMNLISSIRELKGLYDNGYKDTFQTKNLVHRLRLHKERLEEAGGDLFII